jgi:hypothetical protein
MRTLGIDLALTAPHRAIVTDEQDHFITPSLPFLSRWDDIQQVVARAREGVAPDSSPASRYGAHSMAWFTVSMALRRLDVAPIFLVNDQKTYDLQQ